MDRGSLVVNVNQHRHSQTSSTRSGYGPDDADVDGEVSMVGSRALPLHVQQPCPVLLLLSGDS